MYNRNLLVSICLWVCVFMVMPNPSNQQFKKDNKPLETGEDAYMPLYISITSTNNLHV